LLVAGCLSAWQLEQAKFSDVKTGGGRTDCTCWFPKLTEPEKSWSKKKEQKTYLYDKTLFLLREIKMILAGFAGKGQLVTIDVKK
jgi:hypothetical protein